MSNLTSTALVPYITPQPPLEFIRSEGEKWLNNCAVRAMQIIPRRLSSSRLSELIAERLNAMPKHFHKIEDIEIFMPDRRICQLPDSHNSTWFSLIDETRHMIDGHVWETSPVSSARLNGDEIAEVLLSEAGFTIATDEKPVLATYACVASVAVAGYDATNKIAFVVHFQFAREVIECGHIVFSNIAKLAKKKIENPIQLHLRGGTEGRSKDIIDAIKVWMKQRSDLPMEIVSEDLLYSDMFPSDQSISIDSRTGAVSQYDPTANSKSRALSDKETRRILMSAYKTKINVAYKAN